MTIEEETEGSKKRIKETDEKEAENIISEIKEKGERLNKLDELSKKEFEDLTDNDKGWLEEQGLWDKLLKSSGDWESFINIEKELGKSRKAEIEKKVEGLEESEFVKKEKAKIKEFIESKVKEDYRKKILLEELNDMHTPEQITKFITYLHDEVDESIADIWVGKSTEQGEEKGKEHGKVEKLIKKLFGFFGPSKKREGLGKTGKDDWSSTGKKQGLPKESIVLIAQIIFFILGLILTFTGYLIFGLPLIAAGLIILFTTEDLGEKLVNLFVILKNNPKYSIPLGVILGSVVLFFILGILAAIIPPLAALLFFIISKKRRGKGTGFFLEFIVSVIAVILFVGGVQYAREYLFIEFNIWQLIGFGCVNTAILFGLWFMGGKKGDATGGGGGDVTGGSETKTIAGRKRKMLPPHEEEKKLKDKEKQEEIEGRAERLALPPHEEEEKTRKVDTRGGGVTCPECGALMHSYLSDGKKKWKCNKCGHIEEE